MRPRFVFLLLISSPAAAQCYATKSPTLDQYSLDCLDGSSGTLKRDDLTGGYKGDIYPFALGRGSPLPQKFDIEPSYRTRGGLDCEQGPFGVTCR